MSAYISMDHYRDCAEDLIDTTGVLAVDVIEDPDALDRPCIEVTVDGYERVPPRIHRVIAAHDLGSRPDLAGARGQPRHWTLVVV
jgi:hypothetical protein